MELLGPVLIAVAFGSAAGAVVAWFVLRNRVEERERADTLTREKLDGAERRAAAEATSARVPGLEATLEARVRELGEVQSKLTESETRLEEERKAAAERLVLLNDAQAKLTDAFNALSAEALRNNNQAFLDLATTKLGEFQSRRNPARDTGLCGRTAALESPLCQLQRAGYARVAARMGLGHAQARPVKNVRAFENASTIPLGLREAERRCPPFGRDVRRSRF
jgi:hypothetical protein